MKKSLSHAISKGILFLIFAQAGSAVWAAEGDGVEYQIKWNAATSTYHVYMRPNATPAPNDLSISAQVTLRVPHAVNAADNFAVASGTIVNGHTGASWSNSSTVRAPTENSAFDYLSFSPSISEPKTFGWVAGQEQEVFNFKNAGKCLGIVELMADNDLFNVPKNSVDSNPGNQFTNLGWGDANDNNYLGNYGDAADCRSVVPPPTNKPPVAVADTANAVQGVALAISVLANDTDEDVTDVLSIEAVTDGDFGTVAISGDKVVYTPDITYEGNDTFTYTVIDGKGGSSTGTVTVNVRVKDSGLDSDNDGLSDVVEADLGTNPNSADSDQDGISDADEVKDVTAPQDTDKDGIINALDPDDDNDGLLSRWENYDGDASPANDDTDGDGIPDYLDADDDGDGRPTAQEISDLNKDGNPDDALDSDKDGIPDYLDKNTASTGGKQQLAVPTLSQWAQMLLALLLGAVAFRNKFGCNRGNG